MNIQINGEWIIIGWLVVAFILIWISKKISETNRLLSKEMEKNMDISIQYTYEKLCDIEEILLFFIGKEEDEELDLYADKAPMNLKDFYGFAEGFQSRLEDIASILKQTGREGT